MVVLQVPISTLTELVLVLIYIPAAAQRFDQLNARRHLLHSEVHRRLLIAQQSGLRGHHIEVTVHAGLIAVLRQTIWSDRSPRSPASLLVLRCRSLYAYLSNLFGIPFLLFSAMRVSDERPAGDNICHDGYVLHTYSTTQIVKPTGFRKRCSTTLPKKNEATNDLPRRPTTMVSQLWSAAACRI